MNLPALMGGAFLALAGLLLLLSGAIVARRTTRAVSQRRRLAVEAAVRPRLVRLLSDRDRSRPLLEEFTRPERRAVENLTWPLLPVTDPTAGSASWSSPTTWCSS